MRSATAFGMDHAATAVSPISAVPHMSPVPSAPRMADNEPVIQNLMSVGMPEAMARKITGGDTYAGVLSVLAARPSAPGIPDGPGEILVLAGDVNLGVPIAKQLLEQAGVNADAAMAAADDVVRGRYVADMSHAAPIEPHAVIAQWQGDKVTIWSSTQVPFPARPASRTRCRCPRRACA